MLCDVDVDVASEEPVRCIDAMKSSSCALEKRLWPPGVL